jgi:hypothetical protein
MAKVKAKEKRLSEAQKDVLAMACTHGHLSQGCRTRSDYGGRECTLTSLRRLRLLDAMNAPTEAGRAVHAAGGMLTPNVEFSGAPRLHRGASAGTKG